MLYSMLNSTSSEPTYTLATNYEMLLNIYIVGEALGQGYLIPPSVAGWPAYYQTPSFSKLWVNATHIKTRFDSSLWMTLGTGIPVNGDNWKINALNFLDALSDPYQPATIIDDIIDVFCPKGLGATQELTLYSILTSGITVSDWQMEYSAYQANIGNPTFEDPIRTRVELTLSRLFQMPEFQTM